jgi:single-strand DNA-binding protein
MLNRVILVGRLTDKPELRYTQNGVAVARFRLAVARPGKDKGTDFIPVVVWRESAETVAQHLEKGRLVAVDGRLQIREYESGGQRRRTAEVVADRVRFLPDARRQAEPEPEVEVAAEEPPADDIPLDDVQI